MKNTVIKYGLYALVSGFVLFGLPFFIGMGIDFEYGELLGYSAMLISLSFVFFGIKHFRDHHNKGQLAFKRALAIGMLIAICAALGVAIFDYVYTTQINPDFEAQYIEQSIAKMKATLSPEDLKIESTALKQQMEAYGGSSGMALLMFTTVIMLGFVVSLISGLVLKQKK